MYCLLPNAALPVLLKCGEADPLVRLLGGSRHSLFSGAGHWTAHLPAVPGEHDSLLGGGGRKGGGGGGERMVKGEGRGGGGGR